MTTLKEKTIHSLFWKLLEKGGNQAASLIVQIFLARLLVPEDFGNLAILLVFINIGNVIVQSGLNTALVQSQTANETDYSTVFWLCFSFSLLGYGVLFFFAPYISTFYNSDITPHLRILAIVLIVNSFYSVQVARMQRELNFKPIFKATFISTAISGTAGIVLAYCGSGLWSLIVQQIVYSSLNCMVLFFLSPWYPRFIFSRHRARRHYSYGWHLLVSGLLDTGYQSLSDLLIGKTFGPADLGIVSQGKKFPVAVGGLLDGTIQPVMLSAVSRVQQDARVVKELVSRALKTSTFVIIPAMTLLALVAEPLIRVVLGEKWLPAVPFMQMYCVIYAMLPIHTSNLQALNGIGRSDLFLRLEILKKAYGIAILLIATFVFRNLYVIVAGYILADLISTFVNTLMSKKTFGYSYIEQLRDISPCILLTGAAGCLCYPLSMLSLPDLPLIALQSLTMAGAYILLAHIFHIEEYCYIRKTLKEILTKKSNQFADKEDVG